MVFYHAGAPGKNFVYLFHMDLFFISSGYCYRHDSEKKPWEYVKREILTLYVPFVVSCIVLVSLQNLILETYIFSCDVYNKLTLGMWLKEVMKCFFFCRSSADAWSKLVFQNFICIVYTIYIS